MHCREICIKYGAKNLFLKEAGRYESGQKRCTSCEVYINWDGIHCPCCGHFLRTKPRNARSRNILAHKIIFNKFQLKLKLNKETIEYSQKLFNKLNEKNFFKLQSTNLTIAVCIFLASRLKGEQKSIKEISKVFKIKEDVIELFCEMALDEIKTTLVYTN